MADLSQLCIHTITTKPWSIETAIAKYSEAGIKGISIWENAMEDKDPAVVRQMLTDHNMDVVSYVRGGFFPSISAQKRQAALDHNRRLIEQASLIGAPLLVMVCGAEPQQSLQISRDQIREALIKLIPHAEAHNIKLGIEPLHPMYADTRSAVNTLGQANDMAEAIGSEWVGVVVDVYHLWWDPMLQKQIYRCAEQENLLAYHICDWRVPTEDMLVDRGLMGEGCIDLKQIRGWVEDAGFTGYHEVEIFSERWWAKDQQAFLNEIVSAYEQHACL